MPVGSSFWICSISTRTRLTTSIEFAFGKTKMPMKTARLAGEADLGVVIFRAEHDVGDVAQPDEGALVLPDDEILEILHRVQIGVRGQVDLNERAFGAAERGEKIIVRQAPCAPAPG